MEPKVLKSTQIFIIATLILLTLFITLLCIGFLVRYEVDNDVSSLRSVAYWNDKISKEQEIWFNKGIDELKISLNLRINKRRAKNVIVFVGTGIDADVLAAARLGGTLLPKPTAFAWDSFAHLGMLKHECHNSSQSCEPLNRATALFSGVKTTSKLIGLDAAFPQRNCSAALNSTHHIKSIMQLAQKAGKRTGFITSGRITAPSNAALYAHVADADWECDAAMSRRKRDEGCRDTARELMETQTGRSFNVIMGGGRQTLVANVPAQAKDPLDDTACNARDRRNLIRDWQKQKILDKKSYAILKDVADLVRLNGSNVDYILGIFANGNLQQKYNTPLLKDMVNKAITILNRSQGFLMVVNAVVESHYGRQIQFQTLHNLNEAVATTLDLMKTDLQNTLLVVLFENNMGNNFQSCINEEFQVELNVQESTRDNFLRRLVSDTVLYAQGPKAFLLQGLHDETFLAHVIRYALNIGSLD